MIDRKSEIRRLLRLSPEEVIAAAGDRLVVCETVSDLHKSFAEYVADEIRSRNADGEPTRLILPVGPAGQYPILAEILNREALSLADCWFFFMDEYCDESGKAVSPEHPLSLRGKAQEVFLDDLNDSLGLQEARVVFPDEKNIDNLAATIGEAGGIDTCYGGLGIHGHIAFNEPEPGVRDLGPRCVKLNDFTVTINAVRDGVGGNLECFPREGFTIGMREVLGARRLRLFCRNGCEFDWANTVLRLALFGNPADDYPVTWIRGLDYVITTDRETLESPRNLI